MRKVRQEMIIEREHLLDKYTLATIECFVCEIHGSRETVGDKVPLAMRPHELEIVQTWPSCGRMRRVIGSSGFERFIQIRS